MANIACPNTNAPEWTNLVEKVGFYEAYRQFYNNGFYVPEFGPFYQESDINSYLSGFKGIISNYKGTLFVKEGDDQKTNIERARKLAQSINKVYGDNIVVVDKKLKDVSKSTPFATRNPYTYFLTINKEYLQNYWDVYKEQQRDFEARETAKNKRIEQKYFQYNELEGRYKVVDGDIVAYEDRGNDGYSYEELKDKNMKIRYLQIRFPGIQVIEDTSLPIPGIVEKGNKVIRINPDLITKHTIGHEFGHILIDSMGGMQNRRIRQARNMLRGTDIEKDAFERYSDLIKTDPERLDKEILAIAIGTEFNLIFSDLKEMNAWRLWLNKTFAILKTLFGLAPETSKSLAAKMVHGNWYTNSSTYKSRDELHREIKAQRAKESATVVDQISLLRQEALDSLKKKQAIYSKINNLEKTDILQDTIDEIILSYSDPVKSLEEFINLAEKQTNEVHIRMKLAQVRKQDGDVDAFNARDLSTWKDYVSGYNTIDKILQLLKENVENLAEQDDIKKLETLASVDRLEKIKDKKEEIIEVYKAEGINLIAKFLSKYSSHGLGEFKESIRREYLGLPQEERKLLTLDEYLARELELEKDEIEVRTRQILSNELKKASKDITIVEAWVDNILDSRDVVTSSIAKAVLYTDRKSRVRRRALNEVFAEKLRSLEKEIKPGSFKSQKDLYSFMLEKDDKGNYTQNIVGNYSSKFWEDKDNKRQEIVTRGNTNQSFINQEVWKWVNKNTIFHEKDFKEGRRKYLNELISEGTITEGEAKDVINWYDSKLPSNVKGKLSERVSEEAANQIITWYRENNWKYRDPIDKYKSSQWENLVVLAGGSPVMDMREQIEVVRSNKSGNAQVDFYNFIQDGIDEFSKDLPYAHRLRNKLPGVIKTTNESILEGQSISQTAALARERTFDFMVDDVTKGEIHKITNESGEEVMFLPMYYTRNVEESKQSYDVADIYFKYFSNAIDYAEKHEILPELEMAKFLVEQRRFIERDSKGEIIIDKFAGKATDKKAIKSSTVKQLDEWFQAVIYGRKDATKSKFSKIADFINKYTAINLLGFNVVQGTANVALGSTMQWAEAFGGEFYSVKDFIKAKGIYNKNLPGILGDVGSRKPENLVSLLNREFDTLNEYDGKQLNKRSKFGQLVSSESLFFISHAGEHLMQSKVMLAMLNRIKAKDANGNELGTMLDVAKVKDGKLVFEGKNGEEVVNFDQDARTKFEGTMKRVLSSLHGEYSELGRVAIQRYAIGRMVYMFRKFVVPGFKRRWSKKRFNNITEDWQEGNYRTTARFIGGFLNDLRRFQVNVQSDWRSLDNYEKANIKRTATEVVFLAGALVLISMLEGSDEDENWLHSFLAFQAYRLKTELLFFANPMDAYTILRSPAASMSVFENTAKLVGHFWDFTSSGFTFDRYERGPWKDHPKIVKTMVNFTPGIKQIYRTKNIADQISWLR